MRSRTPKVLHSLAGKPIIDHVLAACEEAGIKRVVAVLNPDMPEVVAHIKGRAQVALQESQKGTGHALAQAPEDVLGKGDVLVVNGDQPLLRASTIREVVDAHRASEALATVVTVDDPGRKDGRIVRDAGGNLDRIVEWKDASATERRLSEINVGLYCFQGGSHLLKALAGLQPANAAGELYLTDVFSELRPAQVFKLDDPVEAMGINDRVQLARAEAALRERLLERLMLGGVTIVDPASTFVDVDVRIGEDTVLEPFTILRGRTAIGDGCRIGPYAEIRDSEIGDGCRIERSWLDRVTMAEGADCGPFSKLRPGTEIGLRVHVGSFAEIVRSKIGAGTAVPHLSYLGDATVGERVNIGAGTITANYDGEHKNPTEIGDDSFVGVDTMFVAPRKMGRRSKTGAGSVVTKDIPDSTLAVGMPARAIRRLGGEK